MNKDTSKIATETLWKSWLEKRLEQGRELSKTYWLGLYEVLPEKEMARRLAFSGPLPPCHEFSFTKGNVGTTAAKGFKKVIPDVSIDDTYSACFFQVKSECVLPLKEYTLAKSNLFFYKETRKDFPWGVVDCESEEINAFNHTRLQLLEDFSETLLPFLRMKDEFLAPYIWMDEELEKLCAGRGTKDSWAGIYLVAGKHLELGPYRGFKTEHHTIPMEHGLCGQAVREGKTIVTGDVREHAEYLACSTQTRSEVVIPLRAPSGQIYAELDLDSSSINAYDQLDVNNLEQWAKDFSLRFFNEVEKKRWPHFSSLC